MDLFQKRHIVGNLVILIILYFICCWPFRRIFSRAGYSAWLSVAMLVPLINIGLMWWFAYAKWRTTPSEP
jgi:hypothetical protein